MFIKLALNLANQTSHTHTFFTNQPFNSLPSPNARSCIEHMILLGSHKHRSTCFHNFWVAFFFSLLRIRMPLSGQALKRSK
ncbi:hypothetical protein PRUPE_1G494600 [Prunus persica]|uniref:Uncharacterized protein n=1 Tax=Prunus persica TaxID=3760 RepID=M5XG36_PRUPE|nr:hypothetical protein PRUPE_1G494600 [Prunus persica]